MSYPLIVPASSSSNGVSRARYRPALAAEVGYFARGTVSAVLSGLEPERHVISESFRSDASKPETFDGLYLYVTGGDMKGSQRLLINGAYDGTIGTFALDYPLDDVLAVGSTFEISEMPADDYLGVTGSNTCLNLGLETLPVVDLLDVSATTGVIEYSLANYAWPIKGVGQVFAPRTATTERRRGISGAFLRNDAELPVLVLPHDFTTGDTFTVEVYRPANTWIRQSNAWGSSTTGLTDDTDEALYSVRQVVRASKPFALDRMAQIHRRGTPERMLLSDEAEIARRPAAISRFYSGFRSGGRQRVGVGGGY